MPTAVERSLNPANTPFLTISGDTKNIPVLGFSFNVISPRDASTGMASGKRQWKPVVVTKEWDASSPKLLALAATGEKLDEVVYQWDDDWISLMNATVTNVSQKSLNGKFVQAITFEFESAETGKGAAGKPITDNAELTRIALAFAKIQGGAVNQKSYSDDWTL